MKILYVTTVSLTMNSFFKPHIEALVRKGHRVDLACNDSDGALDSLYGALGCGVHRICFSRSPLSPDNMKAYGQLKSVIENGGYDIVHCHTPNASVITRLVCRNFRKKTGLRVFYTAHGFHFYKGAPKLNWMVYYPVEKFCSRFTDKLITINREDFALAKNKFKAREVHYIPGVGVDLARFGNAGVDRKEKRRELGIPEDAVLLLSVGELNENKNHRLVVQALAKWNEPNAHYMIAGTGDQAEALVALADTLGIGEKVHLIGYRTDVSELYQAADLYVHPSFREGLPVAVMEALASGTTVLASRIRGSEDVAPENLFDPNDADSLVEKIKNHCPNGGLDEIFSQKNVVERIVDLHEDTASAEYKQIFRR
ncbi:MAG: glycosyltransferase family 4 protein [Clostridia bacterium]|nr:glycosyltransferase family 4 protein [Clostridia bacterium]